MRPNKESIGNAITNLMKETGLSFRQLAEMTGITHVSIWRYAKGECEPKLSTLYKIADAFGVDILYFLGK